MSIANYLSTVKHLNVEDFKSCGSLNNNTNNSVIFFYVPNCRFCFEFATEYLKFASMAKTISVDAYAVDLTKNGNEKLITMARNFPYNLNTFPTIIIYYNGEPCSSYSDIRLAVKLFDFVNVLIGNKTCEYKPSKC